MILVSFQPLFLNNIMAHIFKYVCQTSLIKLSRTEHKSQTTMNVPRKTLTFTQNPSFNSQSDSLVQSNRDIQQTNLWIKIIHFVWKSKMSLFKSKTIQVMVEGPAVRKAGNFLDWIAGGLEMNELKGFGNSCPLWTGAPYIWQIWFCLEIARLSNQLGSSSGIHWPTTISESEIIK